MKTFILILSFTICYNFSFSQQEDELNDDSVNISGYISPFFETASMVKKCSFVGGSGGFFVTPNIIIGGFGKVMTTFFKIDSLKADTVWQKKLELDMGGGGIIAGFMFMPKKKIHPVIMLWAGGGSLSVSDKNKTRINAFYDDFFMFDYIFELDYRPFNFLSIGLGAHYQMFAGLKLYGYKNSDFNGYGIYFNVKVGMF